MEIPDGSFGQHVRGYNESFESKISLLPDVNRSDLDDNILRTAKNTFWTLRDTEYDTHDDVMIASASDSA